MNVKHANKYFTADRGRDLRRVEDNTNRRTFEVRELWNTHREVLRLASLGMKNVDIAKKLNVSSAMVGYTLNSPVAKQQMELLQGARDADTADLQKEIREKAPKALKLLEQIIDGEAGTLGELASPSLRAKTAENWLSRAGYPTNKPDLHLHQHQHFTADEINEIKKRARSNGIIVEGEVVEDD